MTIREAVLAWARRMAEHDNVQYTTLFIHDDGYVYAEHHDVAVAWWPMPYLGPDGEAALAAGHLADGDHHD